MEPETEIVALFVPIVSMMVIGLVLIAFFYFRYKGRVALQETVQRALEKGTELTPELLDRLAGPKNGPDGDLRKGLVWSAVGIAFVLFGLAIPDDEAQAVMPALGMFPLLIGGAYLAMWKLTNRSDTEN